MHLDRFGNSTDSRQTAGGVAHPHTHGQARLNRTRTGAAVPPQLLAQILTLLLTLLLTWALFAVVAGSTRDALAKPRNVVHTWKRIYYAPLDGEESLLFIERFDRAKPTLGDLDGDGDLDMLLGRGDGTIMYFQNQGSPKKPEWRLVNESISAHLPARTGEGPLRHIDVGENASPALVDFDGDGDLDLFVGAASGKLHYFSNEGNALLAKFMVGSPDYIGRSYGLNLVVKFADLNGDSLPDLTLGNEAGAWYTVINLGSRQSPRFCFEEESSPECLHVPVKMGQLSPEDNAVPEWVDWDRDGDLDLMVGKSDGTIAYFQNIGDRRQGAWELKANRFQVLDSGGYSAPVFHDVNGDKTPDLILAGDSETLTYYEHRPGQGKSPLFLMSRNLLTIKRLGGFQTRIHLATADLDGDGDLDLMVGGRKGELLYYRNRGSKKNLALESPKGSTLPTPHRAFATLALGDIDGDGDQDLVIGGGEGKLELAQNMGNSRDPKWQVRTLFMGKVDVGNQSTPLLHDMDGDGDLDMLVGNSVGHVVFFENVGNPQQADFVMKNVRFGELRVPGTAMPAIFGWSRETPPDLVVGSQTGALYATVRDPDMPISKRRAYVPQQAPWAGLGALSHAAPHFADINGDGAPDLLLGTGNGSILVWSYEGSMDHEKLARTERQPGLNIVDVALTAPADDDAENAPAGAGVVPATPAAAPERLPLEPVFQLEASALGHIKAGKSTKAAFMDLNNDGRKDVVIGNRDGQLYLFTNIGPLASPGWKQETAAFAGYKHGRNAAPALADVDGDGDTDLVVGSERGVVHYWENTGSNRSPAFTLREGRFSGIRAGKNAVPAFSDMDQDKRPELLVGNLKGEVQLYQQDEGGNYALVMRRFLSLDVGVNANPGFGDLTVMDQDFLLAGADNGKIRVFAPTGTSFLRSSGWKERQQYLANLKLPLGAHPTVVDLDNDGDPDLVVGSDKGPLHFYRNHAKPGNGAN